MTPPEPAVSPDPSAIPSVPLTGPAAIQHALGRLNLDTLEAQHRGILAKGQVSKRTGAVQALNVIEGLRRNKMKPSQLMITKVPVIPPGFRPFSAAGDTFIPGDANELYGETIKLRDAHQENVRNFGEDGAYDSGYELYRAVKALYGYSDPVTTKMQSRGVTGFLKQVSGTSPKFGWVQRRLISKTRDHISRGTISVDPTLDMNQIGLPYEQAWVTFKDHVIRRLVQRGVGRADAVRQVRDRTPLAKQILQQEAEIRPVLYSRAPAWHKFNSISGYAKLIDGDTIAINPFVTTGMNADFDGDQMNVSVPTTEAALKEAKTILLPSNMLFSQRDQEDVVPKLKHEQVLGLFTAQQRPAKRTHNFPSREAALAAIKRKEVSYSDEILINGKP